MWTSLLTLCWCVTRRDNATTLEGRCDRRRSGGRADLGGQSDRGCWPECDGCSGQLDLHTSPDGGDQVSTSC